MKLKLIILSLAIVCVIGEAKSPPEFIAFSNEEILIRVETDPARPSILSCEAKGDPAPKYYWLKNGQFFNWTTQEDDRIIPVPHKGSLVITRPESSDVGQYQCIAENIWGISVSNPAFVRKAEMESFKENATIVMKPIEGEPFHLSCQAPDGYPKPTTAWLKLNTEGAFTNINDSRITLHPEGTLWFSNITQNDSVQDSVYICVAASYELNKYVTGNKVKLEVVPRNSPLSQNLIAPVKQYTSPKLETAITNNSISLYCIFGGTPLPTIAWYKNDEPIQFNDHIISQNNGKIVRIKQITLTDEGNYTCQASNGFGDPISHTISLKILAKPTFIKRPTSAIKAEDETVEFHCEATGTPMPEISWTYNGKPLSEAPFNPRRTVSKNSIIIEKLQINDTGNYACNASSSLGLVYQDVYINVLAEPPQITESSAPNEEIVEASTMVLRCRATGWPNPNITWVKNDAEVSGNRFSQAENGDLTIQKISFADMGNYVCSAQNKIASANITVNLEVRRRTLIPPSLGPSNTSVSAGKSATFRCSFIGDPSLETYVYWLRNGEYIDFTTEPRFIQANDNSLRIFATSKKDNGKYTCVAKTRLDEAKAEATLTVQDVPQNVV